MIESAGERGQETFPDLPRPARVQNAVYQEIERFRERQADRAAGRPALSIPEQLEKLDELRQRGVISQAEFDAKKTQLLDRL
jgi:predicted Zn-dependent peptidase